LEGDALGWEAQGKAFAIFVAVRRGPSFMCEFTIHEIFFFHFLWRHAHGIALMHYLLPYFIPHISCYVRSLQFGTHPIISRYIQTNYGSDIRATFGETWSKTMIAGLGGVVIGFMEVILLPLDALKVKGQTGVKILSTSTSTIASASASSASTASTVISSVATNATKGHSKTLMSAAAASSSAATTATSSLGAASVSLSSSKLHYHSTPPSASPASIPPTKPPTSSGSSFLHIIQRPAILANLYRGASWTAARNSFGCFALFGTSTFVKDRVFGLSDSQTPATLTQNMIASMCGACASIAIAAPLDVVKVRVQAAPLDAPISGWRVVQALFQTEGVWALSKGVVPKMLASAPKVTFSFTVAQTLTDYLGGGSFKKHH
jgi:hypothetical protein